MEQTIADVPVGDAERAAQNDGWLDLTDAIRSTPMARSGGRKGCGRDGNLLPEVIADQ